MIRDYDDDIIYSENGIVKTKEDKVYGRIYSILNKGRTPLTIKFLIFDIIKEHKLLNYILKNEKCAKMYHLSKEELELLKEVML